MAIPLSSQLYVVDRIWADLMAYQHSTYRSQAAVIF